MNVDNKPQKILITGADGYIGSHLREYFGSNCFDVYGSVEKDGKERFCQVDITKRPSVLDAVSRIEPDVIIHTAGLSSLTQCEQGRELAKKVNIQGTRNVIEGVKQTNPKIKLVFLSSEYVFDGESGGYKEDDERNPKTFYGETKKISEEDIKRSLENYIICRTANVYGKGGKFFDFVLDNLKNSRPAEYFDDTFYTPTYIDYLVDSLGRLVKKDYRGVIHIAGLGRVSRYDFALEVAKVLGKDESLIKRTKQPSEGLISKDSSLNTKLSRGLLKNLCPSLGKSLHYLFGNLLPPYFYFEDARGKFLGIVQNHKWEEINFIESLRACVRGNHYHKKTKEGFYIIKGKIKVKLIDLIDGSEKEFIVEHGDAFIVKPNIIHTFEVLEDSQWINMLSKPMKVGEEDIYRR